jgi:drug/metabolite transporter (DMT)-like permease
VSWFAYALAAMFCVSIANVFLKIFVRDYAATVTPHALAGTAALVAVAAAVAYFLFFREAGQGFLSVLLALAFFSLASFALVFLALQTGQVALVMAVLSLGTVVLAIISVPVFGDSFSPKQALAIIFATISVLSLII